MQLEKALFHKPKPYPSWPHS